MMPPSPPRLFVIMAKSAHVAVIVKRGPARWAQLVLWDTHRDVFTAGAWIRGRIYAEKCDLSPDGQLFVYAAFQGQRLGTSYSDSYTAVSRPPWLHALALWPMHTTYGGGGRFSDNRRLTVRGVGPAHPAAAAHPDHPPSGLELVSGATEHHRSSGEVPEAEWSGRDQSGRLVFAMRGGLLARTDGTDAELASFTTQRPAPCPPPEWATRPLRGTSS